MRSIFSPVRQLCHIPFIVRDFGVNVTFGRKREMRCNVPVCASYEFIICQK